MNLASVILLITIVIAATAALYVIHKNKKAGNCSSCGFCCGDCNGCCRKNNTV